MGAVPKLFLRAKHWQIFSYSLGFTWPGPSQCCLIWLLLGRKKNSWELVFRSCS